jgi:hypothetical protein
MSSPKSSPSEISILVDEDGEITAQVWAYQQYVDEIDVI